MKTKQVFCKMFVELAENLDRAVSEWLDFMQEGDKAIEIVSCTQTEDENGFITLVIFAK